MNSLQRKTLGQSDVSFTIGTERDSVDKSVLGHGPRTRYTPGLGSDGLRGGSGEGPALSLNLQCNK